MESRNKLAMCRLCLCENESFINVFELNDGQGYVAAEVISDLLRFQVSETDGYPHVVCSKCLVKLTDFKLFKECCQKSKVKYDKMFVSTESLDECQPEMLEFVTVKAEPIFNSDDLDNICKDVGSESDMCDPDPLRGTSSHVTIKSEEVIIDSCPVSDDPLIETEVSCGPILLKYEVLPFSKDNHRQEELIYSERSGNQGTVESTAVLMQDSPQVKLTSPEIVTHPQYLQYSDYKRPQCILKREINADSCLLSSSTNDKSKMNSLSGDFASSSRTKEGLKGQSILPGECMYMAPSFQQDINTGKEVKKNRKMEEDIDEEGEGWRETGAEKGVRERREGLECFHCGIVLFSKFSLIKHMEVHGFGNSYDCAICGKVFHLNCELKRHVLTHTGATSYKCAECSKCFSQICNLKRHMILHTGSKPYKCTECSKCFSDVDNLKVHMRIHTGYKPYKCEECSKCFSQNSSLKIHMRSHTGFKPYKCTECSKCFSQIGTLKAHMRIHTGLKQYKCAECSKSFTQNGNLKIHMRTHTGSKQYKCEECSKCFSHNCSLKVHMRSHTSF